MGDASQYHSHAMWDWSCRRIALLLVSIATVVSTVQAQDEAQGDSPALTLAQANALNEAHLSHLATREGNNSDAHAAPGYELLLKAPCATARMNANEDWIAYRHEWTRDIVYRKKDQSFAQDHPPCAFFLMQIQDMKRREPSPFDPVIEIFNNEVGGYVVVETNPVQHRQARQDEASPEQHQPDEEKEEAKEEGEFQWIGTVQGINWRENFLHDSAFAFVSPLDPIDGIARRAEYARPSDRFAHNVFMNLSDAEARFLAIAPAKRFALDLVEQEENLLAFTSPGSNDATWKPDFAHGDWARLRQAVCIEHRQVLSEDWTLLAKAVLVYEGNATASMNCLRRAINWHSAHVPAYVLASSILQHCSDDPTASCQLLKVMLQHLDHSERQVMWKTHFPHCSRLSQMATTGYAVGVSVFVGGIVVIITAAARNAKEAGSE